MSEREFDVIVIGGGPAGEVCAGLLGENGLEVALVEEELVGGECSYWACMPSKALLRPGELVAEAGRVPGVRATLDPDEVLRRRDEVIHSLDDSSQLPWLEERGVTLVRGRGRVEAERRVSAGEDELVARRAVVVATGTSAALPPIDGLEESKPWTNREATTAKRAPKSLVVLGGGVVGVELAQAWSSLGSEVTVVEALPRLIAREEELASEAVRESLAARGVDVRLGAKATRVSREGAVQVELEDGSTAEGEELLVAVGRRPRTDELFAIDVPLERGSVQVDERLRVPGTDWLYALGDVNGRSLLTHMGKYQARIAADVILGRDASLDDSAHGERSPRVIFTDPQVAAVGHTLESAREAGIDAAAVDAPTDGVAGGSFYGRGAPGGTRFVVDEGRRVLVGATFVGAEVAELVHAATIAIVATVPLERLRHAVPSFPTRSELWLKLLERYGL